MAGTLQVGGVTLGTHNSGTGKIDLTNAGATTVTTLNTTSIASGTINSAVVIQQKTALITGEHTADFDPVKDSSTLYTVKLNTESDPYNFVTLSDNTVTVTEAGTYCISYMTGNILGWQESGTSTWVQTYLEKGGTLLKRGTTTNVLDLYDRTGSSGPLTLPVGNYVGTLSANDTLKIRIKTAISDFEMKTWTGFSGSGNNNVFAHMLIQKIG